MSYDEWADAYGGAYEDPQTLPDVACPSCGAKTLNLRFPILLAQGDSGGAGSAALWCSTCERGILTCRTKIPPWAEYLLADAEADAAQGAGIPNYKTIQPDTREEGVEIG